MRRHYGQTKAQRQAEWLASFSDALITIDARYSGRIEWPSALHFYHQGMAAKDAAELYHQNRGEE